MSLTTKLPRGVAEPEATLGNYVITKDLVQNFDDAQRIWSKRETQILAIQQNIATMFGSMESIAGNAPPSVEALERDEGEEDKVA